MSELLTDLSEQMFVGPVWPASIMVGLLVIYTVLAVIGLVDLDLGLPEIDSGVDIDVDIDVDPGVELDAGGLDFLQGLGAASVKATNFGRVPMVIWGGIFTLAFWTVSYGLWHGFDSAKYELTWLVTSLLTVRNVVISVGITKLLTQPMLGMFTDGPTYDHTHLIGATCEISTSKATPEFGQAKFRTDAAPLLLNVRTDGPHLIKGAEARIIGFDPQKRIYQVTSISSESTQ